MRLVVSRSTPSVRPLLAGLLLVLLASCGDSKDPTQPPLGPPAVASVALALDSTRLVVSDTITTAATVIDDRGSVNSTFPVTWSASNPAILQSLGGGAFVAVAPGSALIVATSQGVSATAQVEVFTLELQENAVAADSLFLTLSDSAEIAAGTLRLTRMANNTESVEVGDVVFGSESGGYLRRVTAVQSTGAQVVVSTAQATIVEAVSEAEMDFEEDVTLGAVLARQANDPNLFQIPPRDGVSIDESGTVQFNNASFTFDQTGSVGGASVRVKVDGSLDVLLGSQARQGGKTFKVKAKIRPKASFPFAYLKKLTFESASAIDFDATVTTSVIGNLATAQNWSKSQPIFRIRLAKHCPIPVCYTVYLRLDAYTEVIAQAQASMSQSLSLDAGVNAAFEYKDGSGFSDLSWAWGGASTGNPSYAVGGTAGVRFGVKPNIEVEFYEGFGGVRGGLDGAFLATVSASSAYAWNAEAKLVLDLFVLATLDFWGVTNLSHETRLREIWSHQLALESGPLVRLELAPDPLVLEVGEQRAVEVNAITLIGGVNLGRPLQLEWMTDPTSVATVTSAGVVTGVGEGTGSVTAKIAGSQIQAQIPVEVSAAPKLGVDACISRINTSVACTANFNFNRGNTFYLWFGADYNSAAQCGATIRVRDPFTGSESTWVIPSDAPNCLGLLAFTVPQSAAAGEYTIVVGPATLEGYRDGEPITITFNVL